MAIGKFRTIKLDGKRIALLPSKCICCGRQTLLLNQEKDNILTLCDECNKAITTNSTLAIEFLNIGEEDIVAIGRTVLVPKELYNVPMSLVDSDEIDILIENYKVK